MQEGSNGNLFYLALCTKDRLEQEATTLKRQSRLSRSTLDAKGIKRKLVYLALCTKYRLEREAAIVKR